LSLSDVAALPRGTVVLIRFPFTDLTNAKRRPAILITNTNAVRGRDGHFVFMGTEPPPPHVTSIEIHGGSREAVSMKLTFPDPSRQVAFIQPAKIATLDVSLVVGKLGTAPPPLLAKIEDALARILGLEP
jgi:mRNA-degrading endonuclease toxin of MazEF toxin-antitoxin module